MAGQGCDQFGRVGVPDQRGLVFRARDDMRAVRAERGGIDIGRMRAQDGELPAARGVPDVGALVVRRGHDASAVGAEGGRIHPAQMPLEYDRPVTAPEPHGPVEGRGREPPAVGAEGGGLHHLVVATQHLELLARGDLPYARSVVVGGRRDQRPGRIEDGRCHAA